MTTLAAVADSCIRLPLEVRETRLWGLLRQALSMSHPDWRAAQAAGVRYHGPKVWTSIDVDEAAGEVRIPRGAVGVLQALARQCGIGLRWRSDVTVEDVERVPLEDLPITPRPYQEEAVLACVERVQGVVVLPCGGGKTTLGAVLVAHLGQRALVLVHTRDLLDQWVETLDRVGVPVDIGRGPIPAGSARVAMIQSVDEESLRTSSVLLVDECHHVPAESWAEVMSRASARWRIGLSATPEREDGWGPLLGHLLGPVIYSREIEDLISDGYLLRPRVIPVLVEWEPGAESLWWTVTCDACGSSVRVSWSAWQAGGLQCRARVSGVGPRGGSGPCGCEIGPNARGVSGKLNWSAALTALSADDQVQRTATILAAESIGAGRRALVLTGRKRAAVDVSKRISMNTAWDVESEAVTSRTGAGLRPEILGRLRSGRLDAVVATQLADEGLDVPEVDCVVNMASGKGKGRTVQRAGRGCRPAGAPVPWVFDVVPSGLLYQWIKRRRAYVEAYGQECLENWDPITLDEALKLISEG